MDLRVVFLVATLLTLMNFGLRKLDPRLGRNRYWRFAGVLAAGAFPFLFLEFRFAFDSLVLAMAILWERLQPRQKSPIGSDEELLTARYFVFIFTFRFLAWRFALNLPPLPNLSAYRLPIWAQGLTALLLLDLAMYLVHWCCHHNQFLWRWHKVHHATEEMTAMVHARINIGEEILMNFVLAALLIFSGFSTVIVYFYLIPERLIATLGHANVDFPKDHLPGWARWVVTPNVHASHHQKAGGRKNFGTITLIWDHLFGTFMAPPNRLDNFGLSISGEQIAQQE